MYAKKVINKNKTRKNLFYQPMSSNSGKIFCIHEAAEWKGLPPYVRLHTSFLTKRTPVSLRTRTGGIALLYFTGATVLARIWLAWV